MAKLTDEQERFLLMAKEFRVHGATHVEDRNAGFLVQFSPYPDNPRSDMPIMDDGTPQEWSPHPGAKTPKERREEQEIDRRRREMGLGPKQ
jgi:hypothetical protein